ncbi:hypothetical protein [uncultured Methylobacterium sp.]|jgi:hypothetical protein|uniref:hypothetical protein n=1 Tax=uncultured Methylobacterium sp. TaxID=157278 RepID=UPI002628DEBC|nr:hypothetical protein [uncultured Methylobacterium sp.]
MTASAIPPTVLEWSRGFASLSPLQIPCKGYRIDEWRETFERCCAFVDSHGTQAFEMGWDTVSLFGVSPKDGIIRGDWTGVLMPFWGDLVEVTPESIAFGKVRAWRHQPVRYQGIPVWLFGK